MSATERPQGTLAEEIGPMNGHTARPKEGAGPTADDVGAAMRIMSRRSFLWAGATVIGAWSGWHWLGGRRADAEIPWPLRRTLEWNEQLNRDFFRGSRLATTYPKAMAGALRANGDIGLSEPVDTDAWELQVEGADGGDGPLKLAITDIRSLPRVEMVTEFRCIEGWSQIVHWAGARLADFIARYPPRTRSGDPADPVRRPDDLPEYVGLSTPDGAYYVGLDMAAALHPQTLLCYEMNGQPLTEEHGAPLRLVIPVKYGVKNIKRIGTIRYSSQRPADYWAEQGYDWYAGL